VNNTGRAWFPQFIALLSLCGVSLATDNSKAIIVKTVAPSSAAEKFGIQPGDRMLTYDGKPLLCVFSRL